MADGNLTRLTGKAKCKARLTEDDEDLTLLAGNLEQKKHEFGDCCISINKQQSWWILEGKDINKREEMTSKKIRMRYKNSSKKKNMEICAARKVSSNIKFNHGVMSCSKYLEAVPWSESDEDKLRSLFERCRLDEAASSDVLARLGPHGSTNSEDLAVRLIQSVADGTVGNARKEMQSLVSGLLSNSSVCHQELAGLNKESIYCIVHTCLNSLMGLFEEASGSIPMDRTVMLKETKPLVERVSRQVDNINWLLRMLIEKQMAEDFVSLWAKQEELLKMYEKSSPMIRYELSRVSACVFIALGRGKLQCPGFTRFSVLRAWFQPMLTDFGWLQRCSKGLDMRLLEESLGEALLTLPLEQQKSFFMEWFQCFSGQVTECPDLSKAFLVWWRRSFARSSEAIRHLKPVTASNLIYSSLFTL